MTTEIAVEETNEEFDAVAMGAAEETEQEKEVRSSSSDPLRRVEHKEKLDVAEWLQSFGGTGAVQVSLDRREPKKVEDDEGRLIKTDGRIKTYDKALTLDDIQTEHGGGRYQVTVRMKDSKGSWKYAGARTFDIVGEPKLDRLIPRRRRSGGGSDQAIEMANRVIEEYKGLADEARNGGRAGGLDADLMETMMAPMREQMRQLADANTALQTQLYQKLGEKPDRSHEDRVLGLWGKSNDDHSERMRELRSNHESELRQIREFNREELKRVADRHDRDIDAIRQQQVRELDSLRVSNASALEVQKTSYESRIDGLKEINKRIEKENVELKTELAALRARKDLSPTDQIQNMVNLKNAMEGLGITGADGGDDKSTLDRLIEAGGAVAEKFISGRQPAPQLPAAPEEDPEEQMVQVKDKQGNVHVLPRRVVARMQAQQRAQAEEETESEGASPEERAKADGDKLKAQFKKEIAQAVIFMETAFGNGTEPMLFARSAANVIPPELLAYTKRWGVDALLDNVAEVDSTSRLATVAGRKFVRDVASFLVRGTAEPPPPVDEDPEPPVESP